MLPVEQAVSLSMFEDKRGLSYAISSLDQAPLTSSLSPLF
jgi:hypothetical protein